MSAIPKGSLVLVTGANGFIGSHVVDQFLGAGYKVRGTARSESKGAWVKELFDKKYGPGKFELAVVPDMNQEGAFNEAMKGKFHHFGLYVDIDQHKQILPVSLTLLPISSTMQRPRS